MWEAILNTRRLGVKRVFEPFDFAVPQDQYVETDPAVAQLAVLLKKERGGGGDAPLLGAADTGRGATKAVAGAGTHLGDHQQVAAARHDIEFAHSAEEVARQDAEPLRLQECAGAVLGQ